jgi:hypothetical protein
MSKEAALNTARRLVQEALDGAHRAGIDPSVVVAPHCAETSARQTDGAEQETQQLTWCGEAVIIDDSTQGLFEMPEPDADPAQQPAFLVTQATADLVQQDFALYQPSLEAMVEDWREKKALVLADHKGSGT